jgi:hypothetical protein
VTDRAPTIAPSTLASLLAASLLLLSACGGGHARPTQHAAKPDTTTAAGAADGGSPGARAQAQARAFAHAVNLRASDVPGFHASRENSREHETAKEKRLQRELANCVGAGTKSVPALLEQASPSFERRVSLISQTASSEVTVERSPSSIARDLDAIRSGRLRGCVSHYFDLLLEGFDRHSTSISPVSVKQGSPPAPGMTGSFGLRLTAFISVDGVNIPFYMDILGFADKRAMVVLSTTAVTRPFPAKLEETLFTLLVERARASRT